MDFPEKFFFTLKWAKETQNKVFLSFHKMLHSLLLEEPENERPYNLLLSWANPTHIGKILFHKWYAKKLFSNQIAGFFHYQYHWKDCFIIFDFLHLDIHHRKVASETADLGWVCSGIYSHCMLLSCHVRDMYVCYYHVSNGIRTHNHLVRKWTLDHLAI